MYRMASSPRIFDAIGPRMAALLRPEIEEASLFPFGGSLILFRDSLFRRPGNERR